MVTARTSFGRVVASRRAQLAKAGVASPYSKTANNIGFRARPLIDRHPVSMQEMDRVTTMDLWRQLPAENAHVSKAFQVSSSREAKARLSSC